MPYSPRSAQRGLRGTMAWRLAVLLRPALAMPHFASLRAELANEAFSAFARPAALFASGRAQMNPTPIGQPMARG